MKLPRTREAIRSELLRLHEAGESLAPGDVAARHGPLLRAANRVYEHAGGYTAAVRDAGLPVTWSVKTSERILYGRHRNHSTSQRGFSALIGLLPVGFIVTNGDGISIARLEDTKWECYVYGQMSMQSEPYETAKWVISKANSRSVLEWIRSIGA